MNELNYRDESYWYLCVSPFVAASFVLLLCLEIAAVKWLLLGKVKAGSYPVDSGFYVRKWFVDQLMSLSLDLIGPLYATLYLNPWYRLLGARLGNTPRSPPRRSSHPICWTSTTMCSWPTRSRWVRLESKPAG